MSDTGELRFGNYILQRVIGEGAHATTYKAEFQGTDGFTKPVAVKVLHRMLQAKDDPITLRFLEETRLAASIRDPNVLEYYECGRVGDRLFLAMEFIDGPALDEVIEVAEDLPSPVTNDVILAIATQLAKGLKALHRVTVDGERPRPVHRAIRPSNVMITVDGQVKIADFGIARFATEQHAADGKEGPAINPLYMSPEQARGEELDQSSDVFTFGSTILEMINGAPVFDGPDEETILDHVLQANASQALLKARGRFPELVAIIENCLFPFPSRRIPDGWDLVEELRLLSPPPFPDDIIGQLATEARSVIRRRYKDEDPLPIVPFWAPLDGEDEEESVSVRLNRLDRDDELPSKEDLEAAIARAAGLTSEQTTETDELLLESTGGLTGDLETSELPPGEKPGSETIGGLLEEIGEGDGGGDEDDGGGDEDDAEEEQSEGGGGDAGGEGDEDDDEESDDAAAGVPAAAGAAVSARRDDTPSGGMEAWAVDTRIPGTEERKRRSMLWLGILGGMVGGAVLTAVVLVLVLHVTGRSPRDTAGGGGGDGGTVARDTSARGDADQTLAPDGDAAAAADDDSAAADDDSAGDAGEDGEAEEATPEEPPPEPATPDAPRRDDRAATPPQEDGTAEDAEDAGGAGEDAAAAEANPWSGTDQAATTVDTAAATTAATAPPVTGVSVQHTPASRGIRGQAIPLTVVVRSARAYTVTVFYKSAPRGMWRSTRSSHTSGGTIGVTIPAGPWQKADATGVEYYLVVAADDGESGTSGSRSSPHFIRLY